LKLKTRNGDLQMTLRTLTQEELENLVVGASAFSTGGGGSMQGARQAIREIREKNLQARLIGPEDVPNDATIIIPGAVGGGVSKEIERRFEAVYKSKIPLKWEKWPWDKWAPFALKELIKFMGKEPYAYLSAELGPGGIMEVLQLAAIDGKPAVDADTVGRAVPELSMTKLNLEGVPATPSLCTSHFGDIVIVKEAYDYWRVEDIVRSFAAASGGGVGWAMPISGKDLKRSVVPHSYSKCINVGEAVAEAKRTGRDLIEALIEASDAYKLFEGVVSGVKRESKLGFLWGESGFKGTEEFKGHTFRIWFKNENHISWKDKKPFVTSPDLITVVDAEKAEGIWNWSKEFAKGKKVVVIGVRCEVFWRSEKGLEVLGPGAFGFKTKYKPIEQLVKKKC